MITHPYIKYGIALIMEENNLHDQSDISLDNIIDEIEKGINSFRLMPKCNYVGKESISFVYTDYHGGAEEYRFLSPHIITKDIKANNLVSSAHKYVEFKNDAKISLWSSNEKLGMSEVPIVGEFSSFSGNIGRCAPKASIAIKGYGLVTTLTRYKPSISNSCLIPDLEIDDMIDFIRVFKRLLFTSTTDLFIGRVVKKSNKFVPQRPKIVKGNFPNAPKSEILGGVALLGALGELVKDAEYSDIVEHVLDRLKETSIYVISYGDAKSFRFSHHIVELAKKSKLCSVVDSLYYTKLYNQERRTWNNTEYKKFDLFASRFLQLFNRPSFKDFLSFRTEYLAQIEILFITYFNKIENMDKEIISSAKSLGSWLNKIAYIAAINDRESNVDVKQKKSKILVELESSIYSAKTPDALVAQTITRAGRLSNLDAPAEASLFVEETLSGNIDLNIAKNMLVAFSRIMTNKNMSGQNDDFDEEKEEESEDYSQI